MYFCEKNMDHQTQAIFNQTQQFRVVFPKYLNSNGTLFGGKAMQWLDEVAFIAATRYSRQH